jgi:hypothetical protein
VSWDHTRITSTSVAHAAACCQRPANKHHATTCFALPTLLSSGSSVLACRHLQQHQQQQWGQRGAVVCYPCSPAGCGGGAAQGAVWPSGASAGGAQWDRHAGGWVGGWVGGVVQVGGAFACERAAWGLTEAVLLSLFRRWSQGRCMRPPPVEGCKGGCRTLRAAAVLRCLHGLHVVGA